MRWGHIDLMELGVTAETPHGYVDARDLLEASSEVVVARDGVLKLILDGHAELDEEHRGGVTACFDPDGALTLAADLLDAAQMARVRREETDG